MERTKGLLDVSAKVVSAYVLYNNLPRGVVPPLISLVFKAFQNLAVREETPREPAVAPNRSVFPDYIICLEDGRRFKSLKRHLLASYGLTPEAYRARWKLPASYPMVAPNYSKKCREIASASELGRPSRSRFRASG